jgi:hypothetical protein
VFGFYARKAYLRGMKRNQDEDERVAIPLDPEEALRALLQVKPDEAAAWVSSETAAPSEKIQP